MDNEFYQSRLLDWKNRLEQMKLELSKASSDNERRFFEGCIETCKSAIKNIKKLLGIDEKDVEILEESLGGLSYNIDPLKKVVFFRHCGKHILQLENIKFPMCKTMWKCCGNVDKLGGIFGEKEVKPS